MKFIPLHTTNTAIVYKNSLCSLASLLVLVFVALSVMLPVLLVSLLSPYSGISESRVLYEQPAVQFKYQYIYVAHMEETLGEPSFLACSSFTSFNARMQNYSNNCRASKYWSQDLDHDGITDRVHFQLELEQLPARLVSFDLLLFFEAQLQHKCELNPPAVLAQQLQLPLAGQLQNGRVQMKGELKLKQYVEFTCPFPGRNIRTYFRQVQLDTNNSLADISQYKMESLLAQVKANPAYFQLAVQETYYRPTPPQLEPGVNIELELDVLQVPARYHLSIWERLGQFWLYFASFFGISFYIMNKLKDFLFGRHIIRSWEIIPWKKLY